jgi:single-stranded-DNA-specific exonuclease
VGDFGSDCHYRYDRLERWRGFVLAMDKRWLIAPQLRAATVAGYGSLSPLIAQLLANRGLNTAEAAANFFSSDNEGQWHSPFAFSRMRQAVALVVAAIKAGEPIAICGDYDADGVTSSAVLFETLTTLKAKAIVWIPNRLTEGYGLNKRLLAEIKAAGCSLLITVDNGIRSRPEIEQAKKLGLTVIVTDHHAAPPVAELPDCLLINPLVPGETYPFKFLAGVGVAFKLASALIETSNLSPAIKERLNNRILDLVAVGTVADCVNILGENRFLVRQGLIEINRRARAGLNELIKVAQLTGDINTWNISWQLAPRLNVAGRLDHANTAYKLLVTTDAAEATVLAGRLNEQNIRRQEETQHLVEYCQNYVEANLADDRILVVTSPNLRDESSQSWHEGIIGLVAGRLCERYARPALVITLSEGKIKGSGRSIEGYDILAVLEKNKEWLERFGGHKAACGFTVKDRTNLAAFADGVRRLGQEELKDRDLLPVLKIDAELDLTDVNDRLVEEVNRFAPFGQGNSQPLFASFGAVVRDKMTMGFDGQHVKFKFNNFWAVAFGEAVKWQDLAVGAKVDIAYHLEFNDFNGWRNIQLRLVDMKRSLP